MKKMSCAVAVLVVVASSLSGCATRLSRQDLIGSITSVLPAGWHTLDREDGIFVVREKPVQMTSFLSSLGVSAKPHSKTYQIVLSNAGFIPPSEFDVVKKKHEEVAELREQAMAIPHVPDKTKHPRDWEYMPRSRAEENTILEYRTKSQQIQVLPNLYRGRCAFRMDRGFLMDSFEIESEEIVWRVAIYHGFVLALDHV